MSLTAAQIQNNRKTLASNLKAQFSLPAASSDWTYDQRTTYNKAFADYVEAHPQSFSDMDLNTAQNIAQKQYGAMEDTSYDFSLFADTALNKAQDLVNIGGGILKNGIYIAILGAVAYYVVPKVLDAYFTHKGKATPA